jgi:hypothetical protein
MPVRPDEEVTASGDCPVMASETISRLVPQPLQNFPYSDFEPHLGQNIFASETIVNRYATCIY